MKLKNKPVTSRSGLERSVSKQLKLAKIEFEYEPCAIEYDVPARTGKYYPDFRLKGKKWFLEAKGRFTSKDRTKHLRIKEKYPELEIRLLFQRDNRIRPGSDTKYSDWATKHGYTWAIGEKLPVDWLT